MVERKRKFSEPQPENLADKERAGEDKDQRGAVRSQTRGESLGGEGESEEKDPEGK